MISEKPQPVKNMLLTVFKFRRLVASEAKNVMLTKILHREMTSFNTLFTVVNFCQYTMFRFTRRQTSDLGRSWHVFTDCGFAGITLFYKTKQTNVKQMKNKLYRRF